MNRTRVIAEWRRAKRSLGAASACLRNGYHDDAISRAYYAVFHAAKAALRSQNNTNASTHRAVQILFGQHLVQAGSIERRWGSEIGRLYDLRIKADYDVGETFTRTRASVVCQRAERFLERIMQFLAGSIPFAELS